MQAPLFRMARFSSGCALLAFIAWQDYIRQGRQHLPLFQMLPTLSNIILPGSAASAFVSDKDALHSSAYQKILFPRHCHPLRVTSAFISCGVALLSFMAAAPLNFLPPLQIFEAPLSIALGCSCPPCPPASAATGYY